MNTCLVPGIVIFFQQYLHFLSLVSEVVFCFSKKKFFYFNVKFIIRDEEIFKYWLWWNIYSGTEVIGSWIIGDPGDEDDESLDTPLSLWIYLGVFLYLIPEPLVVGCGDDW